MKHSTDTARKDCSAKSNERSDNAIAYPRILWLDWWGDYEYEGLADDPRSGRPAILAAEELKKKPARLSLNRHDA